MFFEKEFNDVVRDFEANLNEEYKHESYSFLGSPLMKSDYLVVGNNWGGDKTIEPQREMPVTNDILDPENKNSKTYSGYIKFFITLFHGDKSKAESFLLHAVYANACFIRTPNQSKKFKDMLNYGYKYSRNFLKRITLLVSPKVIICFGNGENPTCASTIANFLGIREDYWTEKNIERIPLINSFNSYIMEGEFGSNRIKVFSFPHASRYHLWSSSLANTKSFIELMNGVK